MGGTLISTIGGIGLTGDSGVIGGVFISLLSSSRSVFGDGDSFTFLSATEILLGFSSKDVGGGSFGCLPNNACMVEPVGTTASAGAPEEDDDDPSMESGDIIEAGGCSFSALLKGSSLGFSRGINLSTADEIASAECGSRA